MKVESPSNKELIKSLQRIHSLSSIVTSGNEGDCDHNLLRHIRWECEDVLGPLLDEDEVV